MISPIPLLAVLLFVIGLCVILFKKNIIHILMGIELMLNASNLNLVYFSNGSPDPSKGQLSAVFIMILAACEMAIGLAIVLKIQKHFKSINPDEIN